MYDTNILEFNPNSMVEWPKLITSLLKFHISFFFSKKQKLWFLNIIFLINLYFINIEKNFRRLWCDWAHLQKRKEKKCHIDNEKLLLRPHMKRWFQLRRFKLHQSRKNLLKFILFCCVFFRISKLNWA